jgi:hypothetical protein
MEEEGSLNGEARLLWVSKQLCRRGVLYMVPSHSTVRISQVVPITCSKYSNPTSQYDKFKQTITTFRALSYTNAITHI